MQLTVKENTHADYSLHKFNALVGQEFYAYADHRKGRLLGLSRTATISLEDAYREIAGRG